MLMTNITVPVKVQTADQQTAWLIAQSENCQSCLHAKHCIQPQKWISPPALPLHHHALNPSDELALSIKQRKLTQASLLMYGLPLTTLLVATLFAQNLKNEGLILICMLTGLLFGFMLARYLQAYCVRPTDIKLIHSTNTQPKRNDCENIQKPK